MSIDPRGNGVFARGKKRGMRNRLGQSHRLPEGKMLFLAILRIRFSGVRGFYPDSRSVANCILLCGFIADPVSLPGFLVEQACLPCALGGGRG